MTVMKRTRDSIARTMQPIEIQHKDGRTKTIHPQPAVLERHKAAGWKVPTEAAVAKAEEKRLSEVAKNEEKDNGGSDS